MEELKVVSHQPVLLNEIQLAFDLKRRVTVVDGTLGLGGHSEALLSAWPDLSVIGIEWDERARIEAGRKLERFGTRFRSIAGSYADIAQLLAGMNVSTVDGILLDLGVSSLQLDDPERGFSFRLSGPLDMRMSETLTITAWDILNSYEEDQLADIFWRLGEERNSRRVARALKESIQKGELSNDAARVADVIRNAVGRSSGRIDPATRSFQALRMEVNHELDNVKKFLQQCGELLSPGARVAVISFHSLEDRLVKRAFLEAARGCVCPPRIPVCVCGKKPWGRLVTRRAVRPTEEEISRNPRSRSAKLRILEKL
jgi:16S rRNA (cytosine1402-N4)-methyltransferase